jgi:glycosyltransferase involved in cell wall biosynthesis
MQVLKKIALIAHYGEDFITYRINFLYFLKNLDYDTFAIVPNDKFKSEIINLGIQTYFYNYKKSVMAIFYVISTFVLFKNILKKEKPDYIFTYKFFPNIIGIYASSKMKINKIIGTVAGLGFLEKYNKSLFIKLIFTIYFYILNKAHYIIVQNSDDKKIIGKYIDEAKLILVNGSGVNKLNFIVENETYLRSDYNLKDDYIYFLFCTRIVKEKGVFELIEAFNNISRTQPKTALLIAGWFDDKSIEKKILKIIKNNNRIIYFGYQKKVSALISLSDCVILPSYYSEGVPRSLTESLALSKPIITTDHKGCKETCIDGENGFLVNIKDPKDIELKILKFINLDNDEKEKMSKASFKLFETKFEQNIVFKTIVNNVFEK